MEQYKAIFISTSSSECCGNICHIDHKNKGDLDHVQQRFDGTKPRTTIHEYIVHLAAVVYENLRLFLLYFQLFAVSYDLDLVLHVSALCGV